MSTPIARIAMVTLDAADAEASAAFWSGMLGWDVAHSERDYAMLTGPSNALGFGRVEGYDAPGWPNENGSKQFHFDLAVDDLDAAQEAAVDLGRPSPTRSLGRRGGCCLILRGTRSVDEG